MEGSVLSWEGHQTECAPELGVVVCTITVAEMKPELSREAKVCSSFWSEYPQHQWFRCVDYGHVWLVDL